MYSILKEEYTTYFKNICKNYLMIEYNSRLNAYEYRKNHSDDLPSKSNDNLPFVILIGGVGGSGKSSFISFCNEFKMPVYEESTIDCCKDLVYLMKKWENQFDTDTFIEKEVLEKSDRYRSLLHALKVAWCEFDNGPNKIMLQKLQYLREEGNNPFLTFINVREPEQIDTLKTMLMNTGYVPITMCVTRTDASSWTNEGDKETINYNYDIVIDNNDSLDSLRRSAMTFCYSIQETSAKISKLLDGLLLSTS